MEAQIRLFPWFELIVEYKKKMGGASQLELESEPAMIGCFSGSSPSS